MSTKTFPRLTIFFILAALILFCTSCDLLGYGIYKWITDDHHGGGGGENETYSPTTPAIEATGTYRIALGGVAPGRDELILLDGSGAPVDLGGKDLRFGADTDVIRFLPRPEFSDFASGSGAQIVPQKVGFAAVSYYIDDVLQDGKFLVIVPPQSLIQMMVAEASTQLTAEAEIDADYHVKLESVSPTADSLGSVTRNRVSSILEDLDYSLFAVDETLWLSDPLGSYFDAVINAEEGGIYQYSPADPDDPTNETFTNAEARGFLDPSYHRAYDQAVLSATHIFSNETADTTGGAFAFFSPTEEEWEEINWAYAHNLLTLTEGCGTSDSDFRTLDPIQIVILNTVWKYPDGRPSFVFIKTRDSSDYAVIIPE